MLDVTQEPAVLGEEEVRRIVRYELERAAKRDPAGDRAAIIASKGTLDWAYPPLILATTAAASGMDDGHLLHVLRAEHHPQGLRAAS